MAEENQLSLYEKLSKIRKQVNVMERTKAGFKFTYTPLEDILAKITGLMDKYNVTLIPEIVQGTMKVEPYQYTTTKVLKNGQTQEVVNNEIIVSSYTYYTWINNDNPDDKIVVPWAMTGSQADPSQAFGSAMSYSFRYFLTNYFQIATVSDDVEQWRKQQKESEEAEEKEALNAIIEQIDSGLRNYLAENEGQSSKIKTLVSKYAKGGNYFAIKDLTLAGKLLTEVNELVSGNKEEEKQPEKAAKTTSKTTAKKTAEK
jgi:hypothetical protein